MFQKVFSALRLLYLSVLILVSVMIGGTAANFLKGALEKAIPMAAEATVELTTRSGGGGIGYGSGGGTGSHMRRVISHASSQGFVLTMEHLIWIAVAIAAVVFIWPKVKKFFKKKDKK